jgi:hypothetical protein
MNIERGEVNTLLVPGRDLQTHYLLVFQSGDNYQYCITTNTGSERGPLLLEFEEVDSASAVDAEVTLGVGNWYLRVYGQNSSTNLDPSAAVRLVHSELLTVTSESTEPPVYPPSGGTGGCTFDVLVYVDGSLEETVSALDPCEANTINVNITYS